MKKTKPKKLLPKRHCKRAFLNTPIPTDLLTQILEESLESPSSKNTQPWQVCIVQGKTLQTLKQALCSAFDSGDMGKHDYTYSPDPMPDVWMGRARRCGYGLFELKGIARDDHEARKKHNRENFTCFEASTLLIFHLPKNAEKGTFLDMGFFMQSVMLAASEAGLGTCPQFSIAAYADLIRTHLNLKDRLIVSGMSIGFPDENATVNQYEPKRVLLDEVAQWYD